MRKLRNLKAPRLDTMTTAGTISGEDPEAAGIVTMVE
jgi:hypothetical protein